ncbi:MAG: septum formation initiator family protein [Firmicutes bacterium]|nr:septum formation initiator family protein [Candidatus Fermentithermobacillaceae bacterium]
MLNQIRVPASKSGRRADRRFQRRSVETRVSEVWSPGLRPSPSTAGMMPSGTPFFGGQQGGIGEPGPILSPAFGASIPPSGRRPGVRDRGRNMKRRFGLGGFLAVALALMLAITFLVRQSQVRQLEKYIEALEQEIQYYTQANENLRDQINMLRSDQYIEKVAREKLGLVKPGEVQYILTEPGATRQDATNQNPSGEPNGITKK